MRIDFMELQVSFSHIVTLASVQRFDDEMSFNDCGEGLKH